MANIAKELLKKQFLELTRDHNAGFSVGLVDDSNFFEWNVCFEGPKNTLYEGDVAPKWFSPKLHFMRHTHTSVPAYSLYKHTAPSRLKQSQPSEKYRRVDIYNEQEKPEERWRPIWSVEGILVSVISMLNEPNIESPANVDAAVTPTIHCVQLKNNLNEYKRKVRALARMC
ncbi:ubiquitin-conjugating enzyme, putative [Plasmodium ovale curtisi]|uniref:Ubiquitin-conjugating enzyme, putative n=1 Tax=Plasmodium ovale curtisi TaxID=864141 RepID=A0A1A8WIQ0_PLAOA|nr:ubiquitin-conjugating enzyme, putative [Plasmodium ovale curtisi]SBS92013.1 ubiquitin-conjugating enzyme, putative [Plasmodium ovale curtisi]